MIGEKVPILDNGYVQYIEHWGSDERIIEAARMSTDKGFQGWGPKGWKCSYTKHTDGEEERELKWDVGEEKQAIAHGEICGGLEEIPGDEKLLRYLYENKHSTPFEMAGMVIEVQAPILVFREWHRSRTQSYNELSARYTKMPDLHYVPSIERLRHGAQSSKNKQGSEVFEVANSDLETVRSAIARMQEEIYKQYELLLSMRIAKELARINTPVSRYSRMRASANLRNWLLFLTLRMDEHAQWEIRQFANQVGELVREHFPRTYRLFLEGIS